MNEKLESAVDDVALEAWKEVCRELQHCNRDIKNLSQKISAYFYGEDVATISAIEIDCRNYLTAANQRHAGMRRVILSQKGNPHYSHKQVVEFEKRAAEMIEDATTAWKEMLAWVPKSPLVK